MDGVDVSLFGGGVEWRGWIVEVDGVVVLEGECVWDGWFGGGGFGFGGYVWEGVDGGEVGVRYIFGVLFS